MRLLSMLIIVSCLASLTSCGTIGGAVQGLGDDIADLIEVSYKLL